jgi:hypothetical protein
MLNKLDAIVVFIDQVLTGLGLLAGAIAFILVIVALCKPSPPKYNNQINENTERDMERDS